MSPKPKVDDKEPIFICGGADNNGMSVESFILDAHQDVGDLVDKIGTSRSFKTKVTRHIACETGRKVSRLHIMR